MVSFEFILAVAVAAWITVAVLLRWARGYPQALLLMFLAYVMVSVTASVFLLDYQSIYISETGTVSRASNASLRLVSFNALIVGGVVVGFRVWSVVFGRLGTTVTPPTTDQCRRALWLMVGIIGISLANVLLSPQVPYPGSGFARQTFWEHRIRFQIIPDVFGILLFFVPFVCAAVELYGRRLEQKRLITFARVVLALYFAYLLIGGQVFHGLLLPATVVAALLLAERVHARAKLLPLRRTVMLLVGGSALVVTVYLSFQDRRISRAFGSVWDAIAYRVLALQGSTYWQTDAIWASRGATGSLETLMRGREFLIMTIMPEELADSYLGAGVNLQGALPATSLLSLGLWPTVLLCLGYGVLLGFVTSLVYAMAVNGRILLLLPSAYLWLWTFGAYSRASLEEIVSVKYLLFALIVAIGAAFSRSPVNQSRKSSEPVATTQKYQRRAPHRAVHSSAYHHGRDER